MTFGGFLRTDEEILVFLKMKLFRFLYSKSIFYSDNKIQLKMSSIVMICTFVLTMGKNKGKECGKKTKKGFSGCPAHFNKIKVVEVVEEVVEECCVCCETVDTKLSCGHDIHMMCVVKSGKNKCPLCRQEIVIPNEYLLEAELASNELEHYNIYGDNINDDNDLSIADMGETEIREIMDQLDDPVNIIEELTILQIKEFIELAQEYEISFAAGEAVTTSGISLIELIRAFEDSEDDMFADIGEMEKRELFTLYDEYQISVVKAKSNTSRRMLLLARLERRREL